VMSYMCDRARSITWGLAGGLPSIPHGVWLTRDGEDTFLGAVFSGVPCQSGDRFTRPSAGGGGFGDPLERDTAAVLEDVADGYVSLERAITDYGVVVREIDADLAEYEVDEAVTAAERERIGAERRSWLEEDPAAVAERYRAGDVDQLDVIRRHGVILDLGTGELLPHTTEQFRAMLRRRMVAHWA
jgi:N-methylhydantoinase B